MTGGVLYAPGHRPDLLGAALASDADQVILDLEDSVPAAQKADAREQVASVLASQTGPTERLVVRVNAMEHGGHDDLALCAAERPGAVLVPKIDVADEVTSVQQAMDDHGIDASVRLWAMIESPTALLEGLGIARSGGRLAALVVGYGDLATSLGVPFAPDDEPLRSAAVLCLLAARAGGLRAIDGVDLTAGESFAAACARSASLGFDAKTLVSTAQVGPCAAAFAART